MPLKFHTLDVFTDTRFGGNPLGVVLDADGLDDAQMQTIAREFNLSETVFVRAPKTEGHRANIRIFTPASELPFAGHPTVGTACLLAELDGDAPERVLVLEEGVGDVRCAVTQAAGQPTAATFDLPKLPVPHDHMPPLDQIATAHGLEPPDIGFANHVPSGYDAGIPYLMIPVRDRATIERVRLNTAAWADAFSSTTTGSSYLYCPECVRDDSAYHARMFAPDAGIPEDPATGSAVACFAGTIMQFDAPGDGARTFVIEQGFEMGRPSIINLELTVEGGALAGARIGGNAVRVTEGMLEV
ncbi:MAG: PhzF family phenazine biosynthesis protein [Hyphomicrobiaceae bacterium]